MNHKHLLQLGSLFTRLIPYDPGDSHFIYIPNKSDAAPKLKIQSQQISANDLLFALEKKLGSTVPITMASN